MHVRCWHHDEHGENKDGSEAFSSVRGKTMTML